MPLRRNTKPVDPERQLMIKTKACERLVKEAEYYVKEVQENKAIIQKMKDENRDYYDIKKYQEVLDESLMMVPNSKDRLQKALLELQTEIDNYTGESEWYEKATRLMATHSNDNDEQQVQRTNVDDLEPGEAF